MRIFIIDNSCSPMFKNSKPILSYTNNTAFIYLTFSFPSHSDSWMVDWSIEMYSVVIMHAKDRHLFGCTSCIPFSTLQNVCTKSGIWQFLSIRFWCVLSFDFAMWLWTFRLDFPLSSVFLWFSFVCTSCIYTKPSPLTNGQFNPMLGVRSFLRCFCVNELSQQESILVIANRMLYVIYRLRPSVTIQTFCFHGTWKVYQDILFFPIVSGP